MFREGGGRTFSRDDASLAPFSSATDLQPPSLFPFPILQVLMSSPSSAPLSISCMYLFIDISADIDASQYLSCGGYLFLNRLK